MYFVSTWALALLALVPLLAFAYIVTQRRRARFALRYSSLLVVRAAAGPKPGLRRHLPPLFFLLALTSMFVAIARPSADLPLFTREKTIILAIDISESMSNSDIRPTRLEAAKTAALELLVQQDAATRVGIVAFSSSAALVQSPTTNRAAVSQAIALLDVDTSTAIGSAILTSVDAILEEQDVAPANRLAADVMVTPASAAPTPAPAEMDPSALVILLTDGQNMTGPSPLDAAEVAVQRGIRVFTIGVGTPPSGVPGRDAQKDLDEGTLQQIADITHAQYFRALDETALAGIFKNLGLRTAQRTERTELTPALTALAAVLALLGGLLSLRWFSRLP